MRMKLTLILLSLFLHNGLCSIDEDPDSGVPETLPKEALSKVGATGKKPQGSGDSSGTSSAASKRGLVIGVFPQPYFPVIRQCPAGNAYRCKNKPSRFKCKTAKCDYQPRIGIYKFCGFFGCKSYRLRIYRDNYLLQAFPTNRCRYPKERCNRGYGYRCSKICKDRWVKRSGYLWVVTGSYPLTYARLYVSYWIPKGCRCRGI